MLRFDGRVAVVTGASRGIGRAVAQALAAHGAHVVVNFAHNEDAAGAVVSAIEAAGGAAELCRFDVSEEKSVEDAFKDIHGRHKRIDVLVNNAGVAIDGLLLRLRDPDLDRMLAVSLKGAIYCSRAATRTMMRARYGRVITIGSIVGEMGNVGQTGYAAVKAALIGTAKSLAKEYAARSITFNVVSPGFIDTDMTAGLTPERREDMKRATPLGRIGLPQDVASAVLFLASEEAGFITGEVLRVNGGLYM